ncbi:MAG: hypothetical protein HOW97_33045, partial [Catenulispora sp.]|nr:hypothetical protein [Catenulispora sp.]
MGNRGQGGWPTAAEDTTQVLDGPHILSAIYGFGHAVRPFPPAWPRSFPSLPALAERLRIRSAGTDRTDDLGSLPALGGRIEWTVLRAVIPATSEDRRRLLVAFLDMWATSASADSPEWETADRLERLLALLRRHGPIRHDRAAVQLLADRTGLSRPAAAMALSGLVGVNIHSTPLMAAPERKILRLTVTELQAGRSELSRIESEACLELFVGTLPEDPAELWRPGGLVAVAERLAANWTAHFGPKPLVPVETVAGAPHFRSSLTARQVCEALAEPASCDAFTRDIDCWLVPGARSAAAGYDSVPDSVETFTQWLDVIGQAVEWAYIELPAGDPVRAGLPEAMRLIRQRLAHPDLILFAGRPAYTTTVDDLAELFGPAPYTGPVALEDVTFDDGLTISATRESNNRIYFRPAHHGLDERTAKLHGIISTGGYDLAAVRFLTSPDFVGVVNRIASGDLAPEAYECDPRASAPAVVADLADHLGLPPDPTALYLQLLAIPQPTDVRVQTWNGWSPAQHKKAVQALVDHGLVIRDRRPKMGRSVFLPGAWTTTNGRPDSSPIESWKREFLALLDVAPRR